MAGKFSDQPLGEFLDQVAARASAPGGGSVVAISVSLAAGLVAMAARFSAFPGVEQVVAQADLLRRRAAELADADAAAYGAVLKQRAVSRNEDSTGERQRLRESLHRASEIPLEVSEIAAQTARLAASVVQTGNPNLRGDATAGLLLAEAGTQASAALVDLNVGADGDQQLVRRAALCVEAAQAALGSVASLLPATART